MPIGIICICGRLLSLTWTESRKVVNGREITVTFCANCGVEFTRTEKEVSR
jgi:hypothetical protein